MPLLGSRPRAGYLFLAITVGHVILISAQINARSGVPVLEAVTFGAFAEVQRAATSVINGVRNTWSGYIALRQVRAENDALRSEVADLRIRLQEQRALAERARAFSDLLDLRTKTELQTAAAEIIGSGATPDFRTVTIDKGSSQGLKQDMAVLAPGGVVGRVVISSPRAAKVQLLTDRNAAAGALIERSRAQGVIVGLGDDRLRLDYVSEVADVVKGDIVVTSGIDGIFPKGFIIGTVVDVQKAGGAYREIVVQPAVDFSKLEEVLVVTTPPPAHDAVEAPQ
jgi:rod shape-determining protein MreC